ncbi:MAG: S-layer homology domain-containing protein, partial [bacterium]
TIEGTATAGTDGITTKGDVTIAENATLTATAGHGIASEGAVTVNGAVTAGTDGITTKGDVTIAETATLTATSGNGIETEGAVTVNGTVTAGTDGITAKGDVAIAETASLTTTSGYGIETEGAVAVSGTVTAGTDGITAKGDVIIEKTASVTAASGCAIGSEGKVSVNGEEDTRPTIQGTEAVNAKSVTATYSTLDGSVTAAGKVTLTDTTAGAITAASDVLLENCTVDSVAISSGALTLRKGDTVTGTVSATGIASVQISGGEVKGDTTLNTEGLISISGGSVGDVQLQSGRVTVTSSPSLGDITQSGGTLNVSGTPTVGAFTKSAGTTALSGGTYASLSTSAEEETIASIVKRGVTDSANQEVTNLEVTSLTANGPYTVKFVAGAFVAAPAAYEVVVEKGENGALESDVDTAQAGEVVTVTVTPAAQYRLVAVKATCDGEPVLITQNKNGTWSFIMPNGEVEIEAAFKPIFADVSSTSYAWDAIYWAADAGITQGKSDEFHFEPKGQTTRGEMVTFLYRLAGQPEVTGTVEFEDVAADRYYAKAVLWAVQNGITFGVTETTFAPEVPITRAQVVTMLARYAKAGTASIANPFTDVREGSAYYSSILWAYENGIAKGRTATTFDPSANVSRQEVVTFLYRYARSLEK